MSELLLRKEKSQTYKLYYWIPSLYVMEGLPFGLVTGASTIFFKNFNFSNTKIAFYTSLLTIPWFLKPVIAPIVANLAEKRLFILLMSAFMIIFVFMLSLSMYLKLENFFYVSIIILFFIAFASSIYDMNVDGLYISNLNSKDQAHFIGMRTLFYHIGRLACQGGLVYIASLFFLQLGVKTGWQIALLFLASMMLIILLYHYKMVPQEKNHAIKMDKHNTLQYFLLVFKNFLSLPNLTQTILFIILYHFAEYQLIKIVPLFLLDHVNHGGLELSTASVGFLVGVVGIIGMLFGIILSGFFLSNISIQQGLIPITIFTALTNIGYLLLSVFSLQHIFIVSLVIAIGQFGFGISNGLYMLFLLQSFGKGEHSMSLYAIGTALMGLGMIIGGASSGYMQYWLGYTGFFTWIIMISFSTVIYAYYIKWRMVD